MNIKDGPMNDAPTMIEEVSNNDRDMSRIGTSDYGTNGDHIEEKKIYFSKKELQCVDKECKWRFCATKLGSFNFFQVMKCHPMHTCRLDMMSRYNCHASSWLVVGESMRQTYQVGRQYRPKDIIGDI